MRNSIFEPIGLDLVCFNDAMVVFICHFALMRMFPSSDVEFFGVDDGGRSPRKVEYWK